MKELFNSVIRKKVKILIKTLGDGSPELVINLPLSVAEFDSIEWNQDSKRIYLNIFDENLEFTQNFDDLPDDDKIEIYKKIPTKMVNLIKMMSFIITTSLENGKKAIITNKNNMPI